MDKGKSNQMTNGRISFFSFADYRGGAEQIIISLAKNTPDSQVYCISNEKRYCWPLAPESVHYDYSSGRINGLFSILKNIRQINESDVCYSSQVFINSFLGLLKRLRILKVRHLIVRESTTVFSRFGTAHRLLYKCFYYLGYQGASLVVCQNEQMKEELQDNIPFLRKRNVRVIPNPIDFAGITKDSEIDTKELSLLKKGKLNMVTAGRLIPAKGYEYLLDALALLRIDGINNIHLIIMGEGPSRDKLIQKAEKLGLSGSVHFPGFVQNPFPMFKAADICVLPSVHEGFPNALLQMMSLNPRIVSTLCADGVEKLPDIRTCPVKDARALADAIKKTLQHKPDLTERLSWLQNHHSIKSFLAEILKS